MGNKAQQMKLWEDLLSLIERRRIETGDPHLGSSIERVILDSQLEELERDILENPGAFEPWLVRRRGQ